MMSSTLDIYALAEQLGQDLQRSGRKLATAESCTGGLLAGAVTAVPGASAWFERGYVTYSNWAKREDLGVSEVALVEYGAVSEPVALEMASGMLLACAEADVAVSVTGIAGPDGGTAGKPVGLVCFGFATRAGEGITSQAATHIFEGDRAQIRMQAVAFALQGVLQAVGTHSTDVRTAA
ncbi:MAG: nicotinamide-nucleotide amidohydrolase family protein [Burkholderiaceae bacterium]|nr:nicotinamide-nucleotide amidohydrolase family protein [Burkholderiaceae bacterium]